MTVKMLALLLATAAVPTTAALAQTAAPAPMDPPAATSGSSTLGAPSEGSAIEGLPAATAEQARGGVPDTDVSVDTTPVGSDPARTEAQTADGDMPSNGPFVTDPASGAWRAADLQGKSVYGLEGESIGEIDDLLVNARGEVTAVIIGVGGFLGIGEKDVAVRMDALRFGPGDGVQAADAGYGTTSGVDGRQDAETTGSVTTQEPLANGGATMNVGNGQVGTTVDPDRSARATTADDDVPELGGDGLPERIVLSVTREQLEEAPEFKGVEAATSAE